MQHAGAVYLADLIRKRKVSSAEVVQAHLQHIATVNGPLNAAVEVLGVSAVRDAEAADAHLQKGKPCGPLHGVPFSIKDSIEVASTRCSAGTLGFKNSPVSQNDATLVARLRAAGGIPIAKTNLPDLLFSFESDNYLFGRTNNPYDLARTAGGSSGGEAALIAAGASPLGLGSDCAGSVRLPAGFCGIAGIKPTSGRLPRTGHVPPFGGWIEKLWQIGPMARSVADLVLAMRVLSGDDAYDWTAPPVPLLEPARPLRIAFFTDNGVAPCDSAIRDSVTKCAELLASAGCHIAEARPPCIEECYGLELALLGADGGEGIDAYLREIGSDRVHPLTAAFIDRTRPFRCSSVHQFAALWARWDAYRTALYRFFQQYDAVLCPLYTKTALPHGESALDGHFEGFSYTMAWNVAGYPAATVRCSADGGLPVNVQVAARPWQEMTALSVCQTVEDAFGGWPPSSFGRISR